MAIDFEAAKKRARALDAQNKGQREREQARFRANEQAAMERHGYGPGAMEQLVNDLAAQRKAGGAVDFAKAGQRRESGSALASLAEEIAEGLDTAARVGAARPDSRMQRALQERGRYIGQQYQSGRLPGTGQGAEPLGAGSFGGARGFRNVENAARIASEAGQRRQAQRDASRQAGQWEQMRQALETQEQARKREQEALLPAATAKNLTLDSFMRGYENARLGEESYKAMSGTANEREAYLQRLADERYQFAPKGLVQRGISGAAELLGQQYRQWTNPRSLAMGGTAAATMAFAGQAGPQALVPEEVLTVPAAFTSAMAAGSAMSNFEIEAGSAYNEMLDNGISPEVARAIALGVGGVNAALESLQADELVKGLKAVGGNPATQNTARRILEELGRRGLEIGNETLQEVAQEASAIIGAQAASKYETGDWAYNAQDVTSRLKDTAVSSALSFGVMNAPGAVRNSIYSARVNAGSASRGGQDALQGARDARDAPQDVRGAPQDVRGAPQNAQDAPQNTRDSGNTLGDHGVRNYQYLKERDGGKTADFDAQYRHYYDLARSGLEDARIPQAASTSPLDTMAAQAAMIAGRNDGVTEAAATVQRLRDGGQVSDAAIDRALSFPETRGSLEELVGALSPSASRARGAVREWQTRQADAVRNPQPVADLTVRDNTSQGNPSPVSDLAARDSTEGRRAAGLAETEISRKLKAEDREFLDTILQAVGLRGELVSETSDVVNAKIENGVVTVYANADDAAGAYRGTVRHEVTHQIKALGAEHYQAFEDFAVQARAARDGVSVETLVESTQDFYRTQAGQELTAEQAREEIAGDFAMLLDVDTGTVRQFVNRNAQSRRTAKGILQTIRDILSRIQVRFANRKLSREQRTFMRDLQEGERLWAEALGEASQLVRNEKAAQMDGERARYSIKQDEQGRKYVHVDVDQHLFDGLTTAEMQQVAKDIILDRFRGRVIASGENRAFVNKRTAEHYAYPANRRLEPQTKQDKMRASTELDNLMEAAVFWKNITPDQGKHKEATGGLDKFITRFEVGGRWYTAEITRLATQNGDVFYELSRFNHPEVIAAYENSVPGRKVGLTPESAAASPGDAIDTSIADSGEDVNGQFSLKNADAAVTRLAQYRERYGTIPRGEQAIRDIMFPKQIDDNTRVRRFARTAAEAGALTDEQAGAIGEAVAEGRFSYEPIGDRAARNYAEGMLGRGEKAAAEAWAKVVARDTPAGKNDIALGEYLLKEAAKAGDTERVVQLAAEIAAEGTRAGQVVQAMRLLKQLDGAGQLVSLDATLKKLQGELDRGKSGVFLKVSDALRQELAGAKGETEVNAALDKIYDELAAQLPSSWVDKWDAWRYFSMLGNPRTHIRNVLGNAAFEPAILVKNVIGTGLERVFVPRGERTKSLSGLLPRTGGDAMCFAQADFREMKDIITGGGKMNPADIIRERKAVFKNRALEWARKQNFNFLEAEDGVFLEHQYVRAMTQFLKANHIDVKTLDVDSAEGVRVLNRAREYAVKEAQKATYRDFSVTAQVISQASRKTGKPGRILIEGVLPFKKTPVNVLKRGVEYSPVGLADTLTRGVNRLRKGKISASEFIDGISTGLTGTGIAALGLLLAKCGVLVGGGGDDEEQDFRDALGAQSWAFRFGDTTYTIDWLAPSSMPLFVGAEVWRLYENGVELNGRSVTDAALSIAEPVTQMSMLDGLNSMLSSVRYGDNPLSDLVTGAAVDFVGQSVPTLLGQIARTVDPVRRTVYDDKNSGVPSIAQKTLQKNANKIPFLSRQSAAYLDLWGREQFSGSLAERALQNFISPGYLRNESLSEMESELIRLYRSTGSGDALPGKAAKYFTVGHGDDARTKHLTADEYQAFAEMRGTLLYSGLSEMAASPYYQALADADRVDAVGRMAELANAVAKTGVSEYVPDGWHAKAVTARDKYGVGFSTFVLAYSAQAETEGLKDKDGESITNSASLLKMQAIYDVPGLTQKQREYLFEACGVGEKVRHYNKARVEQEIRKMKQKAK